MAKLNRIRVVLAERDLNNKWLSDKLGKDPATVSKWVTNTTQPSLEALIAIANALEVPVQELVREISRNDARSKSRAKSLFWLCLARRKKTKSNDNKRRNTRTAAYGLFRR